MNVLLITTSDPKYSPFSTHEKIFPVGIGFLISVLRDRDHKVFFIDQYLAPKNKLTLNFLINNNIDFIGISLNTICFASAKSLLFTIQNWRERGKWGGKIIVGGPHTTVALETIPGFVDFVIQGEGEKAIIDIIDNRLKSRVIRSPRIKDLDSLPPPAWDFFVKLPYDFSCKWFKEKPVFNMNTSRGCPFRCTFCSVGSIWGKEYTFFSAKRIIEDIRYLIKRYGAKGIYFREDNFTFNKIRTIEFCELLLKENLNIKWACETRVDTLNKNLLQLMYKSGCRGLYIGVESGVQRLLNLMSKGITLEQIENTFKWCNEIGIPTYASFITGLPTETEKERKETIEYAEKINPAMYAINIFVGIPRGPLYEYVLNNKLYEYIDDVGLVYLKGHDKLVDRFYSGNYKFKIPQKIFMKKLKYFSSYLMKG